MRLSSITAGEASLASAGAAVSKNAAARRLLSKRLWFKENPSCCIKVSARSFGGAPVIYYNNGPEAVAQLENVVSK